MAGTAGWQLNEDRYLLASSENFFLDLAFGALFVGASVLGSAAMAAEGESPQANRQTLGPGLVVERVHASIAPPVEAGDRIITLVRIDPQRYRFRLLTKSEYGSRTAPEWVREFNLAGVINASMFLAEDQRSTGFMVDGEQAHQGLVNSRMGAFLAWGAVDASAAPLRMFGRGCAGFDLDQVRKDYEVVIQNYRMLDCNGQAIAWKDPKAYSVAAVGVDKQGWLVFIHSRTPYKMADFNRMIAAPELGLAAVMYVEGGPEASVHVKTDAGEVSEIGSWETGFFGATNDRFWQIPNVIGFEPVGRPASEGRVPSGSEAEPGR